MVPVDDNIIAALVVVTKVVGGNVSGGIGLLAVCANVVNSGVVEDL
jgi:hypothetical protein